jgi:hypothetical protein
MLNGLGVPHGVDLDALMDAGDFICGALGRASQSRVARAAGAARARARAAAAGGKGAGGAPAAGRAQEA